MGDMSEQVEQPEEQPEATPTREDLVNFISEFMTTSMNVDQVYRSNLVETLVGRVFAEFGEDGLCDLMLKIDFSAKFETTLFFIGLNSILCLRIGQKVG